MMTRLESASGRHLLISFLIFTICQIVWFSLGSIAPYPRRNNWSYNSKVACPSSEVNTTWVYNGVCNYEESYNPYYYQENNRPKQINWQNVTSIDIGFQFNYVNAVQEKLTVLLTSISSWDNNNNNCNLTLDFNIQAKLGYRYEYDSNLDWKLLAASETNQSLDCYLFGGNRCNFACKNLALFELQNLNYPTYLLNMRISTTNEGSLVLFKNAVITSVFADDAFSRLWWSMKSIFTIVIFVAILWYRKQLKKVSREASLLERMIMALAITLQLYNIPLEWLTLLFNFPFFEILNAIRKDILYVTLMIFWLIFTKEHIQDSGKAFRSYRTSILLITLGCIACFTPTLVDSAFHSMNPFYSLWSTSLGTTLELVYVISISSLAFIYLFYLMWTIRKVYTNPYTKSLFAVRRSEPPIKSPSPAPSERFQCCSMFNGFIEISLSSAPRKFHFSMGYRYTCIVILTGLCATLTVIDFVVRRVTTDQWKWNGNTGIYMPLSEFYTGVYGLWNVYAVAIMYLYSPVPAMSSKEIQSLEEDNYQDDDMLAF